MDDQYLLTTPENVPISYELAGVGSRFVAALFDTLVLVLIQLGLFSAAAIIGLLLTLVSGLTAWWNSPLSEDAEGFAAIIFMLGSAGLLLLSFAILLGYPLLFEIIWNGQTPGKRLTGIRLVRGDGGPITALAVVIRNVLRLVDFLPMYYITGVIVMLIDSKARRLGDMAAGVICIKERRDVAVSRLALLASSTEADEPAADGEFANLNRLTYDEYRLVKEFLLRRDQMAPDPAHHLAVQIADRIAAKLDVELADQTPEDFLFRIGVALERQGSR